MPRITIDLEPFEVHALEAEYKRRGLGIHLGGSVPSPMDSVITKTVEAVRAVKGTTGAAHRYGPEGRES